jgi:hypothetical protein
MGFALVNCSQVLPSGKNLWDRLKLKQEIKPTIFETAPWTKPTQVIRKELKDVASLKKFVENTMAPKGVEVITDKDLMKHCGFSAPNKSANADVNGRGETCFVFVKGSKYSKFNSDLEERIVRANPKLKIATIDAVKKRLSFEDPQILPASMFEMKVHALRNGTHYMSMVNPLTWDYVTTFMSQAQSTPSYSYSGDYRQPVKLIKTGSSAFKSRSASSGGSPSSQPTVKKSNVEKEKNVKADKADNTEKKTQPAEKSTGEEAIPQPVPETLAEKFAREKKRREEMEKQSNLFEEDREEEEEEGEGGEEEEDNVIEL